MMVLNMPPMIPLFGRVQIADPQIADCMVSIMGISDGSDYR